MIAISFITQTLHFFKLIDLPKLSLLKQCDEFVNLA